MLVKYNDIELPYLPDGITLDEYPYIWIRKNDAAGSYDLAVSTHMFYYNSSSNEMVTSSGTEYWYRIWYGTTIDENTQWEYCQKYTGGDTWTIDSVRTVMWSILDIPLDSETSTNIYYEGSPIEYPTQKKYLVRDGSTLYTVIDSTLSELTGELTASLFQSSGVDTIPDGALLMTLATPEVLCWTDADTVPKLTATVTATPQPQVIITDKIYLTDKSITGVESVLATCEGELIVAVSFDDKQTWKAWNGEQWATLSDDNTGMSKETLEGITFEQWNELYAGATGFYVRVSLLDTTQSVEKIVFDFSN